MMNKDQVNIFLDMDEVLSGFFEHAMELLNEQLGTNVTKDEYIDKEFGWKMHKAFDIDEGEFWEIIDDDITFWENIKPLPWAVELYEYLTTIGEVTIVSSPSKDPNCWAAKVWWLENYLGITSKDIILGSKKYLLAGNGVLIDDSPSNIEKFKAAGGKGILVPATWNTKGLTFEQIKEVIDKGLANG
jgi:5'(3')-deoxyribonucleotidase